MIRQETIIKWMILKTALLLLVCRLIVVVQCLLLVHCEVGHAFLDFSVCTRVFRQVWHPSR